jgi:putative acetyltransferase
MAIEFVGLTPGDYEEVIDLWRHSEGVGLTAADSPEGLRAFLERNPGLSLAARLDGKVVGAVLCGHDGRRGYLHHLAVAPQERRQGIGRGLVEACLTRLSVQGIEKCHIWVRTKNGSGLAFWRAIGWLDRDDLKIMSKETEATGPEP